jgi:tetratricopeptide (TPR) repeat protein
MGVVYAAFDPELDRKVALKLMRREPYSADSASASALLLREAQAMAKLSHPNIIPVFDVGTFEGRVFVTMELVEGSTVRAWLKGAPRAQSEVLRVFREAGTGLSAAHDAGIVHRDFKPDNVLVSSDGRVRVSDFGLAGYVDGVADAPPTASSASLPCAEIEVERRERSRSRIGGTPGYMAPEQRAGTTADARSDQYAFCVSLAEALSGERPDPEAEPRVHLVRSAKIPSWLRAVLARGLDPDPDRRFASMHTLRDALARRPRRRIQGALVAAAAVAVVFAVLGLRSRARSPAALCAGAAAEIGSSWNPSIAARVAQAFVAVGGDYGGAAAKRVSALLDAYAARWAVAKREACEATRVRGFQSEEVLDLRMHCLDRRRREVEALAEALLQPDATVIDNAVPAVGRLTPLEECANAEALKAPLRLPSDPAKRRAIALVEGELAMAKAAEDAGKLADAKRIATDAAAEAGRLAYGPVEAEAEFVLGRIFYAFADFRPAGAHCFSALSAAERSRDDRRFADAAICVSRVASATDDRGQGERWLTLAEAVLARMGHDDWLEFHLLDARGALEMTSGRSDRAVEDLKRALGRIERFAPQSPARLITMRNLGINQIETREPADAQATFEHALALAEALLGTSHPTIALLLTGLGTALIEQGNLTGALPLFRRAVSINERARPKHINMALAMCSIGQILCRLGACADAVAYFERAVTICEETAGRDNVYLGSYLSIYADTLRRLGRYPEALAVVDHAARIAELHPGSFGGVLDAPHRVVRAQVLLDLHRPREALPLLETALRRFSAKVHPFDRGEARFALARALSLTHGDLERARDLARQAIEDFAAYPSREREISEIRTWLAAHPPSSR